MNLSYNIEITTFQRLVKNLPLNLALHQHLRSIKKKKRKNIKLRREPCKPSLFHNKEKERGGGKKKKVKQRKIETWTIPFPDNDPTSI